MQKNVNKTLANSTLTFDSQTQIAHEIKLKNKPQTNMQIVNIQDYRKTHTHFRSTMNTPKTPQKKYFLTHS
jgi:hypothetical protein